MAVIRHVEVSVEERLSYFKMRRAIEGADAEIWCR